ncbi:unnamed protein product [Dicrocoelium dendriticum]|nr:unnamed protein product [Dicrocoelium dendriticum]
MKPRLAEEKSFALQLKINVLDGSAHCFELLQTTKAMDVIVNISKILRLSHIKYFGIQVLDKDQQLVSFSFLLTRLPQLALVKAKEILICANETST